MGGNAEFRVVLKIWASAHTTLTAVIVRIGNEKSACVDRSTAPCCWVLLGDNSVGSGKYGYPGFRGLDSCGLRLNHDREAFADMSCSHKNVILIVTNGSKKSA